jgi:hypothetical protein
MGRAVQSRQAVRVFLPDLRCDAAEKLLEDSSLFIFRWRSRRA